MDEAELEREGRDTPVGSQFSGDEAGLAAAPAGGPGESGRIAPDLFAGHGFLSLLFCTQGSVWRYIVRVGLIGLLPSLVVVILLSFVAGGGGEGMPQFNRQAGAVVLFVSVVIVSPVVETLLLGFGLWVLSFVMKKPLRKAIVSCVVWAVLHSCVALLWGAVVVWPFFVFSCAYLAWRRRSWWHAMGVACGIHMFQNLLPGVLIAAT